MWTEVMAMKRKDVEKIIDKVHEKLGWWKMEYKTFKEVKRNHPELMEDPGYNPNRFPKAFEDALLMVAKQNGLIAERSNIDNPFAKDYVIKRSSDNKILFEVDVEYDYSDNLFDKDKKEPYIKQYFVNVPIEKLKYFQKVIPTIYVKGSKNLKWVLALRGSEIAKCKKIETLNAKHGKNKNIIEPRTFIRLHTRSMIKKGHLKAGHLQSWLILIKELFPMIYFSEVKCNEKENWCK